MAAVRLCALAAGSAALRRRAQTDAAILHANPLNNPEPSRDGSGSPERQRPGFAGAAGATGGSRSRPLQNRVLVGGL